MTNMMLTVLNYLIDRGTQHKENLVTSPDLPFEYGDKEVVSGIRTKSGIALRNIQRFKPISFLYPLVALSCSDIIIRMHFDEYYFVSIRVLHCVIEATDNFSTHQSMTPPTATDNQEIRRSGKMTSAHSFNLWWMDNTQFMWSTTHTHTNMDSSTDLTPPNPSRDTSADEIIHTYDVSIDEITHTCDTSADEIIHTYDMSVDEITHTCDMSADEITHTCDTSADEITHTCDTSADEIAQLVATLRALAKQKTSKRYKLVKENSYVHEPTKLQLSSWRMSDWEYKRENCPYPTMARGLFTRYIPSDRQWRKSYDLHAPAPTPQTPKLRITNGLAHTHI
ncbi:hypothetical protein BC938DRAFT_483806 [Jimgerdemannia flammicorona]|uniref:Uncharacterized protein n=1 Tax=Jimgerdemannia flammicorona TaxID=994334 RepID=A0A433R068_9FUNG|nr:hypothetical protein BC938DRAFT_483806 [Jimgerdemannia flammicorona]